MADARLHTRAEMGPHVKNTDRFAGHNFTIVHHSGLEIDNRRQAKPGQGKRLFTSGNKLDGSAGPH